MVSPNLGKSNLQRLSASLESNSVPVADLLAQRKAKTYDLARADKEEEIMEFKPLWLREVYSKLYMVDTTYFQLR